MKIMFMGTPDFAVNALQALVSAGHDVISVVTMPDRPRGRGHKLSHTPVYERAEKLQLPIVQPVNLKKENFEEILLASAPEIIVVAAYGNLLPEYVLSFPKYGCVNVHGSLLPEYRGAAPIQRSIIDGKTETGITTMYMEKGLDTGDMLLQAKTIITEEDTYETLHDKLAQIGADLIVETLQKIENGTCPREKQEDSLSCYAARITKETCKIDWNKNAKTVYNLIRGLFPVPKAYTGYLEKALKIGRSAVSCRSADKPVGTILSVEKDFICIQCGEKSVLEIYELQMEGKKMMAVSEFLKGNQIELNTILR